MIANTWITYRPENNWPPISGSYGRAFEMTRDDDEYCAKTVRR